MKVSIGECVLAPRRVTSLGKAWAENAVNCMAYRCSGLTSGETFQIGSYFDDRGDVRLFSLARQSGRLCVSDPIFVTAPIDAHFATSIAYDGHGAIHVVGGAHVTRPFYCRGSVREDGTISVKLHIDEVLAQEPLTYPTFVRVADGSLYILYRLGSPGRSVWKARAWDGGQGCWVGEPWTLFSGGGAGVWPVGAYFNTPLVRADGRVGFFLVWRSEIMGKARESVMNIGIDYVEVDLARRLAYSSGDVATPLPITPSISERVLALPWFAALSNQSGAAQATCQWPFGAAIWREGDAPRQIRVFWRDDRQGWCACAITAFTQPGDMRGGGTLYLPYSRPVCVSFPDSTIGVVYRVSRDVDELILRRLRVSGAKVDVGEDVLLFSGELGGYEPVVDYELAASSGILSMYLQNCGCREDGRAASVPETSDAYVVDWEIV